ncbi:MAG: lysophospholipid acyltransferase family protein [Candidatus Binatia bacterium]|nr:lysophospholipid acyltransferase family protein [Candidatus Binatia bacterium]
MKLVPRGSKGERFVVEVGGYLIHLVLRVVAATSRHRYVGAEDILARFAAGDQLIMAFWHGRMVMTPFGYKGAGACIMNSRHRDGALISRAIERLGVEVVHGSSSQGWVGGLKGLLLAAERGRDLVVVPDGPRGPRCRAKGGVVQLARATGLPIFPTSTAARRQKVVAKSWDWLCIPWPFTEIVYAVEEPIWVSSDASQEAMEEARLELERRLNRATETADRELGVASGFTAEYIRGGPPRRRRQEERV